MPAGHAAAHRQAEDLLGQLGHAGEQRGAAGDHDARGEQVLVAALLDLALHEREDLLDARLDDLGRGSAATARAAARPPTRRHLDRLVLVHHARPARSRSCCLICSASCDRRAQPDGDVAGQVVAAERR